MILTPSHWNYLHAATASIILTGFIIKKHLIACDKSTDWLLPNVNPCLHAVNFQVFPSPLVGRQNLTSFFQAHLYTGAPWYIFYLIRSLVDWNKQITLILTTIFIGNFIYTILHFISFYCQVKINFVRSLIGWSIICAYEMQAEKSRFSRCIKVFSGLTWSHKLLDIKIGTSLCRLRSAEPSHCMTIFNTIKYTATWRKFESGVMN